MIAQIAKTNNNLYVEKVYTICIMQLLLFAEFNSYIYI